MRNAITPFLSCNSSIGHVIYEMSSGHVLSGVVPTEEEYERVKYDEVKELLHFIFNLVVSYTIWGEEMEIWERKRNKLFETSSQERSEEGEYYYLSLYV